MPVCMIVLQETIGNLEPFHETFKCKSFGIDISVDQRSIQD